MLNTTETQPKPKPETPIENKDQPRKSYQKPLVQELGDLRTLTLGGTTIGGGDSGTSLTYNWPI